MTDEKVKNDSGTERFVIEMLHPTNKKSSRAE